MAELRGDTPLQYVKGVGPRRAEAFAQHGLQTAADLLRYFPRRYLDRTSVTPMSRLRVGETVTVIGVVKAHGKLYGQRRRYEAILADDFGAVTLVWFAAIQVWERLFKKGELWAATGIVGFHRGFQIIHPELERLADETDRMIHAGRIVPVYPQTQELSSVGLSSRSIRRITTYVVENLSGQIADPIPRSIAEPFDLPPLHQSLLGMHYPETLDHLESYRRRLAFGELLEFQFLVQKQRRERRRAKKPHLFAPPGSLMSKFKTVLPFKLTEGQVAAVKDVFEDLQRPEPMSRLVQGDVGCGKTVVAIASACYAVENRLQCAFMAPTEVLARQHFNGWHDRLGAIGVRSACLTSGIKAKEKEEILSAVADGTVDFLFGTHALIYDEVIFRHLGLVIIDEQHRFGVRQRGKLHEKGENPDLLVLTATPIPRTLALTLYGDLDVSSIRTLPPGRLPVKTHWRPANLRERVFAYARDQVAGGRQGYVIYPSIDSTESEVTLIGGHEELSHGLLAGIRTAVIHGRLKPKDRDRVLAEFQEGKIQLLFATTLVEVGIDNPAATLMVIEQANRFGLAQLHQLRGRIGRGKEQAHLIALAVDPVSEVAQRRLEYFAATTDGFEIAEADLELRGPGELYGQQQSGVPNLLLTRLADDKDLLEGARQVVSSLGDRSETLSIDEERLRVYLQKSIAHHELAVTGG